MSVRLFVALDLPPEARAALARFRDDAADPAVWRPVGDDALHVTLAFLGHRPEAEVAVVEGVLAALPGAAPPLVLAGALLLPPRRARVLCAAIADPEEVLGGLQRAVSDALAHAGVYEPERRPFRAHATVARLRSGARPPSAVDAAPEAVAFAGEAVTLYRSQPGPGGGALRAAGAPRARLTAADAAARTATHYSREHDAGAADRTARGAARVGARRTRGGRAGVAIVRRDVLRPLHDRGRAARPRRRRAGDRRPPGRAAAAPGRRARRRPGAALSLRRSRRGGRRGDARRHWATSRTSRRRFVVLGFDQRGTGRSGLIRCPEMQRDGRVRSTAAAARCAARLGARRAFYTTPDSVEDIEAIRAALRVERLTLFGISYGTQLALEYARAHPEAVERLVLDSVVDPDDTDPFGLAGFRAMPHTLEALCPADCRGVSADPARDLARLTAALRAEPLRGPVYDAAGRGRTRTLTPTSIADLLYDADYAPQLRAAVPAAVRAALDHADPAPLLRLQELASPLAQPEPASAFSAGRYATVCEETPLPWDAATPPAERAAVARARAEALDPDAFAPFDAAVAFADEVELCLRWPAPFRPAPAAPGPYPDVPALLLQGEEDLRTPPSASAAVAARLPQAQRVVVPGVGHAVVAADFSGLRPAPPLSLPGGPARRRALPARADRRAARRGAARALRGAAHPARAPGPRRPHDRRRARDPGRRRGRGGAGRAGRRAARRPLHRRGQAARARRTSWWCPACG